MRISLFYDTYYTLVWKKRQRTNLDPAVESCKDDAVQKQDTIQHIADLWF